MLYVFYILIFKNSTGTIIQQVKKVRLKEKGKENMAQGGKKFTKTGPYNLELTCRMKDVLYAKMKNALIQYKDFSIES